MRVMVASMLAVAGLATGFLFCPPLQHKMARVLFGQQAQVKPAAAEEDLAAHAAALVKEGAATALRCVQTKAMELKRSASALSPRNTAPSAPAAGEAAPGPPPATAPTSEPS
jgi:hypothetical protein